MADIKPYERYKKDTTLKTERAKKKKNIENYTDFQKGTLSCH